MRCWLVLAGGWGGLLLRFEEPQGMAEHDMGKREEDPVIFLSASVRGRLD